MCYRILVASYSDGLTSLLFDPKGPTLKVISEIKVGNRPSWLTAHPDDPTLVFTGLEQSDGVIIALKFNEDGNATVVGQIPSGGADPASLLATTNTLLVGNVRRHCHPCARKMLTASGWVNLRLASTRPELSWLLRCPPRLHISRSTSSLHCCSSKARAQTRNVKRARTRTTSCPSPDAPNS
jgi:hypothetical protein